MKRLPSNIKRANIEYVLSCEQVNHSYKRCIEYHAKHKWAHGWGAHSAPLSIFRSEDGGPLKFLQFRCKVGVIHIEYETDTDSDYQDVISPIPPFQNELFVWKIEEKNLSNFKNARVGQLFYSDTFCNDCLFFMIKPNGSAADGSKGYVSVALRLLIIEVAVRDKIGFY